MTTKPQAFHPSAVQAAIEQIRYWVPTIKDVANVFEGKDDVAWLLSIEPKVSAACPVAIAVKPDGRFDISIAGETYENRVPATLDQIVQLLERICEGRVVQRQWMSTATGAARSTETLVTLASGLWQAGATPDEEICERRDRHFLPYRRI